ncbi:MAG TPA: 50S ribosomal protein L11 methyltransferase [Blastocatellia bacterium]|nr:50S ribosomal protein L11 methyltransferase [Blastocatellia bacterium]
MKIWHAIEVEIARVGETAAATQLWAFGTTGIEVSEDKNQPDWLTLRAYFEQAPDEAGLREQILRTLRLSDLPEMALRSIKSLTVADQDWLAEWKKGYEPLAIGEKLLIVPSWKLSEVSPGERIVIQIDPGMAFGTGTHETTRGCLEMLEKYWPLQGDGALLDAGTGTGILAFAAAKLAPAEGNARIIGFDIDPEAIEVAQENAAINGVADRVELEVNRLSSYHGQAFDVVLANLTADVIVPLAADFAQVTRPGGVLIVSGILREQGDEVLSALRDQKFDLLDSKPDGEWVTLALRFNPVH